MSPLGVKHAGLHLQELDRILQGTLPQFHLWDLDPFELFSTADPLTPFWMTVKVVWRENSSLECGADFTGR